MFYKSPLKVLLHWKEGIRSVFQFFSKCLLSPILIAYGVEQIRLTPVYVGQPFIFREKLEAVTEDLGSNPAISNLPCALSK